MSVNILILIILIYLDISIGLLIDVVFLYKQGS